MPTPNLLFIYTDEQAAGTMRAYGNDLIETPNMDRLAADGVVFEQAYCTQSVCTPSRSSILTGLYPHATGCTANNIPLPADVRCLPELADFSGYRTGHFGKWHLGDEIFAQHGFQEWVSMEDGYRKYYGPQRDRTAHSTYYHWLVEQGFQPQVSDDGFAVFPRQFCTRLPEQYGKPAYLAREASRFIRQNRQRPFILYVNFLEPHMPFFGPRDDQYDPDEVPLPHNFHAVPGHDQPARLRQLWQHYQEKGASGISLTSEAGWRRLIANYWGLCSLVDTYLGKILDTLAECGLADSTIVVFTSDHGDMMGSHGLVAKTTQYQEAVRVPLLMRVPWLKQAPARVPQPVSQVDLVPTLLDLLGQPVPANLQGNSWAPYLENPDRFPARDVFIQWNSPGDPVRTIIIPDGFKLNCSPLGEHELYDLVNDPGETCNLIRDPTHVFLILGLYQVILAQQQRVSDPLDLSQCEFP